MTAKLNVKQEAFIQDYVRDFNATRAYKLIYGVKTDKVACVNGTRLLSQANVKTRLAELLAERAKATKVDSTYVIEYLKGAAELDLDHFATIGKEGIEVKDFKKIDRSIRKYCTEVSMSESKTGSIIVNFKIFSKEKALDMLAKHTGAVKETTTQVNVNLSLTDLVDKHS